MKLLALAIILTSFSHLAVASACIDEPAEKLVAKSQVAFVATITSSTLSVPLETLKNGEWYRIDYTYTVRKALKGNPALVTGLFSLGFYHDPEADVRVSNSAEFSVVPGNNVLVLANKAGESPIGFCGSTAPWSLNTRRLKATDSPL